MAGADRPDVTAIPLGRPSPSASSNQPERQGQRTGPAASEAPRVAPIRFCSRRGLPCRRRCRPRGALLPHPFTLAFSLNGLWAPRSGGLLSVALSLGSPPPDVIRRRIRMEPGLSSAFQAAAVRPTGWRGHMGPERRRSSGIGRGWSNGRPSASPRARNRRRGLFIVASRELWDCAAPVGGPVAAPHQVWAR
jgi:hypothetical protein